MQMQMKGQHNLGIYVTTTTQESASYPLQTITRLLFLVILQEVFMRRSEISRPVIVVYFAVNMQLDPT